MPTLKRLKIGLFPTVVAIAGLALLLQAGGRTPLAQAHCDEPMLETDPGDEGYCGTTTWNLSYTFDGDGGEHELEPYQVSGACYVFTDCNCIYHNGQTAGSIFPDGPNSEGDYGWYFSWTAYNYIEYQFSECESGKCKGKGVTGSPFISEDTNIDYTEAYCY